MSHRYDASGDQLSRTTGLPAWDAFTACGWARRMADRGNYSTIWSLDNASSSPTAYLDLQTNSDGDSLIVFTTDGPSSTVGTLINGRTFFWAITSDGAFVRIYYMVMGAPGFSVVSIAFSTSFTPAFMGIGANGFTEWFNGEIGNVKIWKRALTRDEIQKETLSIVPVSMNQIYSWSPLKTSTDLGDYSGNGNSWTAGGTLTTGGDFPVPLYRPRRRALINMSATRYRPSAQAVLVGET